MKHVAAKTSIQTLYMELKHVNKQPLSTERTDSRHQTDSPGTGLTPSREERNVGRGSGTRHLGVSKEARGASTKWQEMLPAAQQCAHIVYKFKCLFVLNVCVCCVALCCQANKEAVCVTLPTSRYGCGCLFVLIAGLCCHTSAKVWV